jgi:hypothetical protein
MFFFWYFLFFEKTIQWTLIVLLILNFFYYFLIGALASTLVDANEGLLASINIVDADSPSLASAKSGR